MRRRRESKKRGRKKEGRGRRGGVGRREAARLPNKLCIHTLLVTEADD